MSKQHPSEPRLLEIGEVFIFNRMVVVGREKEVRFFRKGYEKRIEFNCDSRSRCPCGQKLRLRLSRFCEKFKFVEKVVFGGKSTGEGFHQPVFGEIKEVVFCPDCGLTYRPEIVLDRFGIEGEMSLETVLLILIFQQNALKVRGHFIILDSFYF